MNIMTIILMIAFGFIVAEIARAKGYVRKMGEPKENSQDMYYIVWWICGAALFIVSIIWVCVLPNKYKNYKPSSNQYYASNIGNYYNDYIEYDYQDPSPTVSRSVRTKNVGIPTVKKRTDPADEIRKYKDLLDSGAITPEEYNAKKQQLLGL